MPDTQVTEAAILQEYPRMALEDRFTFRCAQGLDCFTRCCADVAIVLTPYDVLRLKRAVGTDSTRFLEQYTIAPFTKEQKVPVVLLKMVGEARACPFVGADGCRVYASRPWACRIYPLGTAKPRTSTAEERAFHFLLRESHCHGHDQGQPHTVREWLADQGVEQFEAMGGGFETLMLHPFWDTADPLGPQMMDMYYTACYDLDSFRRFVFDSSFLDRFEIAEARVEAIRTDDEELLEFAVEWLRFALMGERTMKLKDAAAAVRRPTQAPESASVACDRGSGE